MTSQWEDEILAYIRRDEITTNMGRDEIPAYKRGDKITTNTWKDEILATKWGDKILTDKWEDQALTFREINVSTHGETISSHREKGETDLKILLKTMLPQTWTTIP